MRLCSFPLAAVVFSALALFTSGTGDARNFAFLAAREELSRQRESHPLDPRRGRLVTKTIDEIRPGDVVLALEEHGTKLAPRGVTQVFRRTTDHLRVLEIADAARARQTLKTTDEHPFWVEGRGWLPAGDLEPGAVFTSAAGAPLTLVATEREPHPAGTTVYKFEVDGYHTYYVAQSPHGNTVLVHNAKCRHHGTPRQIISEAPPHLISKIRGKRGRTNIVLVDEDAHKAAYYR